MENCNHTNLIVLKSDQNKLRCRHCHLTIDAVELGDDFCPECYATSGFKKYDFDPVASPSPEMNTFRCEDCGLIIEDE